MNNFQKLFLGLAVLLGSNTFADDIWFVSPQDKSTINGMVAIQIQPPYEKVSVNVWIESDMGRDQIVWRGKLTEKNNYTVTVDTSKFKHGRYEINAEYNYRFKDYDGDIEVWVGTESTDPNGQYFPQ